MHESEQQQTSDFDIMENYNFYVTSPLKCISKIFTFYSIYMYII